jgi:hypothetical protein
MTTPMDLDALIVAGALDEVDPVAARIAREDEAMWEEFRAALFADVDILVAMAEASNEAREKEDARGPQTARELEARRERVRRADERYAAVRAARIAAGQTESSAFRSSAR